MSIPGCHRPRRPSQTAIAPGVTTQTVTPPAMRADMDRHVGARSGPYERWTQTEAYAEAIDDGVIDALGSYHRRDMRLPDGIDVEGPVQAEVFVIWLDDGRLALTGPCGSAPWLIELADTEHPIEAVARIVRGVVGEPILVHSTSWRRDGHAVILTFIVAIAPALVGGMESAPIGRADLARSAASAAPRDIGYEQVLEHGLRHLAWLSKDDPVVGAELGADWRNALAGYVPEPFMALG